MAVLLGVDTGGTYTDAVVVDADVTRVLAKAKALTTRPDLAGGIAAAIDAVLTQARIDPSDVALVSLSTTLATNALVEGVGGRVALVFIGFDDGDFGRGGLTEALRGDPVVVLSGGHDHGGREVVPLDLGELDRALGDLPSGVTGFAVASRFAVRNPAHEQAARDAIRVATGLPVTCSHELSNGLGGPKRALTAVLNARLIGMIDRLIGACEAHMARRGIDARLMVVRGDGALMTARIARERPIETILSGPAASAVGAGWLTGEVEALVSDIGGTTTDVCLLRDGRPRVDPLGARVGAHRTMIDAVAMRTTGLGGDSEVHLEDGLPVRLTLGPRRVMPVSLLAMTDGPMVHRALDVALSGEVSGDAMGRFVVPLADGTTVGLDPREAAIMARLKEGPAPLGRIVTSRVEAPALDRLVARGFVMIAAATPSDAAHVGGLSAIWDRDAAVKVLTLLARRRTARGERFAPDAARAAALVLEALTDQTVDCLLEAAFAEGDWADGPGPEALARHLLTRAGLEGRRGVLHHDITLGVPLVGLGASASRLYGPVGARLRARTILPRDGDVANAIGAVAGRIMVKVRGSLSDDGKGTFTLHLPDEVRSFTQRDVALTALDAELTAIARARAMAEGVEDPDVVTTRDIDEVEIEGRAMFLGAQIEVVAQGRPRIAVI